MSAQTSTPLISVVVPAYNAQRHLPLQLEALDSQDEAPRFEVIVVNNGSTDDTAAVIDAAAGRVSYPLVRVDAADFQGPGYARNVGAAHARADLLMFTDADDVVSRWWLKNGLRAFRTHALWSGGARLMTDEEMTGSVEDIRRTAGDSADWVEPTPGDLANAFPVVMGCDFGVTREVFERIGGFDQSLGTVFEDNDFGVRAHLAGIPVADAHAVRIAYRGKWGIPFRAKLARGQARGHQLVAHRYGLRERSPMPHPLRELTAPVYAAAMMAAGRRRKEWGGPYLRLVTGIGLAEGRLRYGLLGRSTQPQIGVGYGPSDTETATTPQAREGTKGMSIPGGASARRLLLETAQSRLLPHHMRMKLLGRLGLRGADDVRVVGGAHLVEPRDLVMGAGSFINDSAFIDRGPVVLGKNVYIGPRAVLITARHSVGSADQRAGQGAPAAVTVGDGTWIGANATVLPGVTIGGGCVIAAGAVVTADCEANGLYVGVPARRVKDLPAGPSVAVGEDE
ncbi:glycosyltransferase [Micrococcus sp. XM4230B]|uniref:glycosyltransferase n=1 Tax=Micrococcus sp. XM4230B TaxID=2929775 RepID=UPI001FFB2E78|nr:glycosyltransferase [Micrococcus sp. XM4230B]